MVAVLTPFFKDGWTSEGDFVVELGLTLPASMAVLMLHMFLAWLCYFFSCVEVGGLPSLLLLPPFLSSPLFLTIL